jgi:hypothetical protein
MLIELQVLPPIAATQRPRPQPEALAGHRDPTTATRVSAGASIAKYISRQSPDRLRTIGSSPSQYSPVSDILLRSARLLHPGRGHKNLVDQYRAPRVRGGQPRLGNVDFPQAEEHLLLYGQAAFSALGPPDR